jgi:hypothetical protein
MSRCQRECHRFESDILLHNIKEKNHGAVTVMLLVVGLLIVVDKNMKG